MLRIYGTMPAEWSRTWTQSAETADGRSDVVINVTSAVTQPTSFDWTEVVLLGTDEVHDTVAPPLGKDKTLDRSYIPTAIFRRFARFSDGVDVKIDTSMTKGGGKGETGRYRSLKTLSQVLDRVSRWEELVDRSSGVIVRYVHDPKHDAGHSVSARANPATSSTTFCALVHKAERYDLKTQKAWSAAAPNFGIPFGSKVLTVEIELPDMLAQPNQYRDALTYPADREPVSAEDYAPLVREMMPDWVRDVIKAESPQRDDNLDDLREDLQRLLDEFRVPTQTVRIVRNGLRLTEEDGDLRESERTSVEFGDELNRTLERVAKRAGHRAGQRKLRLAPDGAEVSELSRALERAPEIQILDREEEVAEKGIQGRAAAFYRDIQTVFVNGLYSGIDRMASELEQEFPSGEDPEQMRALVIQAAQRWAAFRVGKAICFALAKRILNDWTTDDVDKATTPEALSMAADDYRQSISAAKRWVTEQLRVSSFSEAA